ncbi:hypothetical protein Tfer_0147 [Thermincola ferriacetica]|uniref:EamA domain-containing protein n=1 Tax=Thermincola ferriacetica TaxID=281456 RepID=A0A0L6W664_9FIRM|nr:DMT family transporter [Thermincola ferriacetica]KNZ71072.1 hypothetical protein Tfer_0147 [Thermincola ferriacetica]
MNSRKNQLLADLALVFVTAVWGATFVSVKEAITRVEPFYFLAIRFGIATLLMLLITNKRIVQTTRSTLWKGILIGLALFAGYSFQTFGLQYTTASNAGFITGLSVVIVPVTVTFIQKKPPGIISALGIISATVGLGLLTINATLTFNYGDLLVLFCAFSYALHILLVGKYSPDHDAFILATVQIGTVALASFVAALIKETAPTAEAFNAQVWRAILITAVFATALAFFVQTWTQKYTSPTHTAIIFTMEPVFAAIFAYFIGGESFTLRQGIGAVFILAGMLAAELGGHEKSNERIPEEAAENNLKT